MEREAWRWWNHHASRVSRFYLTFTAVPRSFDESELSRRDPSAFAADPTTSRSKPRE